MKSGIATLPGVNLLADTTLVLANEGMPLMWAGMLHLVIGNAIIGIAEGALLAR